MVPKSFYTDSVSDVGRSHSRLLKLLIVVFAQTQTVDVRTKAHCWKTGGHVLCFPEWRKQTPLAQVQGHSWIAHICTPCVCFSGFAALERQNRHPIQSEFATKLFKRGLPLLSFSFSSTLHFHCDRPVNKLQGSPCLPQMASPKVNPQEISIEKQWQHTKGVSRGQTCS